MQSAVQAAGHVLPPTTWSLLPALCRLLRPFYDVTRSLSTQSRVSLSLVWPMTAQLINHLSTASTHPEVHPLQDGIMEEFKKRYETVRVLCEYRRLSAHSS